MYVLRFMTEHINWKINCPELSKESKKSYKYENSDLKI